MGLIGTAEARAAATMLRQQMDRMANPGPVMQVAAAELDALIDESIAQGRSPSGARWARQKAARGSKRARARRPATTRRDGSHPVGQRTGALRSSVTIVGSGSRIVGEIAVPYALFFHTGGKHQRPRPLIPVSKRGNPMRRGPAGDWLRRFIDGMVRYVVTGSVSL